ncbi:cell division cycle-associated protein 7-like protein [Tanacetum coccineum]
MVSKKNTKTTAGDGDGGVAEYEQSREERIKENLLRMQKLGIMELSRNLKPAAKPKPKPKAQKPTVTSADDEPRRSSSFPAYFEICGLI